jgi:hypothetical protein
MFCAIHHPTQFHALIPNMPLVFNRNALESEKREFSWKTKDFWTFLENLPCGPGTFVLTAMVEDA